MLTILGGLALSTVPLQVLPLAAEPPASRSSVPFSIPGDWRELPATALIETTKGPFEVRLAREKATVAVANFLYLFQNGYFRNSEFAADDSRPGLLVVDLRKHGAPQAGDWTLPPEYADDLTHVRGAIGWMRAQEDSALQRRGEGRVMYLCREPRPDLDGFSTLFGLVVRGMRNAASIESGDRILAVRMPGAVQKKGLRHQTGTGERVLSSGIFRRSVGKVSTSDSD